MRRTAVLLEDALRTASLPDAGGRLLLVRRVDLGAIGVGAGAPTVARALERAVERARVEVRHGAAPGAEAAPAVWFRDALEAHVCLAERLLSGPPPTAWYWPSAVPGWRPGRLGADGLQAVVRSLAALPEAPAAVPRWVEAVGRAAGRDALAEALGSKEVRILAAAAGREGPAEADGGPRWGRAAGEDPGRPRPGRADGPGAGGGADPVREILERLAGLGRPGPGREVRPRSPEGGSTGGRTGPGEGARAAGVAGGVAGEAPTMVGSSVPSRRRAGAGEAEREDGPFRPRESRVHADPTRLREGAAEPGRGEKRGWEGAPTDAAGLLFLVAALNRCGHEAWLEEHPAWRGRGVAPRVLAAVLRRLAVPPDDPAWQAVERPASVVDPADPPGSFVAPALWGEGLLSGRGARVRSRKAGLEILHDASGRLLLEAWPSTSTRGSSPGPSEPRRASRGDALRDAAVGAWNVALRRWLRRYARLGVADLVLRPGQVGSTPTHLDVVLDLGTVDLRVRRAGLDLDPGWVPWLGRVVGFRYERTGP